MKEFNNDKNTFNKSLKKKFDDASIQPSNAVWEGIEGALLKHENVKMQKTAVFYRNIAAAVLLIAAVSIYFNVQDAYISTPINEELVDITNYKDNTGTADLYINQSDVISRPQVLENSNLPDSTSESLEGKMGNKNGADQRSSNPKVFGKHLIATSGEDKEGNKTQNTASSNKLSDQDFIKQDSENLATITSDEMDSNSKYFIEEPLSFDSDPGSVIAFQKSGISKVENINPSSNYSSQLEVPQIAVEEVSYFAISNLDQVKSSSRLAFQSAFNVGSGSFNPNANIASGASQPGFAALNSPGTAGRTSGQEDVQNQYSAERQLVDDMSNAPIRSNISMTFGVQFGVHLNERLKIRTGLQYGNYRSSTESSAVIRDINSDEIYPYHGASNATELADGKIVNITSEYDVYNDFKILSVPLIVSYKFLDRKFGIGLVAGATADIMLRNTIRGGDDQISEISFDNYESQSYKNLFYSGIAGVEFSYNFSKNYSLSLTPTYKKAFMNITNDNASFNSTPDFLSVDMSIQFTF